jgi:hypothetical protein
MKTAGDSAKEKLRLDTKLEADAAEFLVLGHLLLNRISAFKAYANFPGYDLIATNADNNSSARLQVKSRYRTDWDGFIIKNLNCDFVIFVALNRGYGTPKKNGDRGIAPPEFYVLPRARVDRVRDPDNAWGKIVKKRLTGIETFKDRWDLISDYLAENSKAEPRRVPDRRERAPASR